MKTETKDLLPVIDRFRGIRVAVWGDFILDEYVYGNTRRISREAPVLILSYRDSEYHLGGAGNSLNNLKALGACPVPVGVLGRDSAGDDIVEILRSLGVPTSGLFREKKSLTPLKSRILAGEDNTRKQQILRIDREGQVPRTAALGKKLEAALGKLALTCRALLVSDYNHMTVREDVFQNVLPAYQKSGLPVTLDSRFRLLEFKGGIIATPNEPEVEQALQMEIRGDSTLLKQAASAVLKKTGSPALLITRGSRGMALFEKGKAPLFLPIFGTTDIVDVTGAGDTVISVFTLALAAGATPRQAAVLANHAGGIVVMKKGAATLTPDELKQAVQS
ncbi:MAG: PfkB family carbohydrate kinase [Acidobacteriota bacterium]|nr:PfkB family carbohydrate kinase [Acidobacteriota bacterium]